MDGYGKKGSVPLLVPPMTASLLPVLRIVLSAAIKAEEPAYYVISHQLHYFHPPSSTCTFHVIDMEEARDALRRIMEKYDEFGRIEIYADDWGQSEDYAVFLRDENPRKQITVVLPSDAQAGRYPVSENARILGLPAAAVEGMAGVVDEVVYVARMD